MYVKLFRSILTSTVWMEPTHVLRTWLTLLLLSDPDGNVLISVPGLAKEACITIDQCREALAKLESPDPESQHREEEGRRILRIGDDVPAWHIVNYAYYRGLRDKEQKREYMREYQKFYRSKKKVDKLAEGGHSGNANGMELAQEEGEVEEEEEKTETKRGRFAPPTLQEVTSHVNEKPSTLPAPEPSDTSTVQVQKRHSTTRASSLTPSSLTPDSPLPESGASTDLFETFYNPYLRHDARLDAEKAWARLSMQDRLECLEKTPTWVKAKAGTEKKFIPLPATFLNKKRWRDPLEDLTEKVGGSPLQAAPSPAQKCWRCENTMNREDLMGSTKFCRECRKKGAI